MPFGREAVAYIDRHKEHPFFLYLTFNAVHTPMHAIEKYLGPSFSSPSRTRSVRTYAAMTAALDANVGRVMGKLCDAGLEENTLIFYVSDNGGPPANASDNSPLRPQGTNAGRGIRVPFFIEWKGNVAQRQDR